MTDHLPSKDLITDLNDTRNECHNHGLHGCAADVQRAIEVIERLCTTGSEHHNPRPKHNMVREMRLAGYHEWANAMERLQRPAHEREPPHCSSCACGLPARHDVVGVIQAELDSRPGDGAPPLADRIAIALAGADLLWRDNEPRTGKPPGDVP